MKISTLIVAMLILITTLAIGFWGGRYYALSNEYERMVQDSLGQLNYLSKIDIHLKNGKLNDAQKIVDGELIGQLAILSDPAALNLLSNAQQKFVEVEVQAWGKYLPQNKLLNNSPNH